MARDMIGINGRKQQPLRKLDEHVTYCYDRFDLQCGSLDLYSQGSKDYKLTQRRAQRWMKRAERYVVLRENMGVRR